MKSGRELARHTVSPVPPRLRDDLGFGLDARAVGATELELDDYPESDADYRQITLTLGFSP